MTTGSAHEHHPNTNTNTTTNIDTHVHKQDHLGPLLSVRSKPFAVIMFAEGLT